MRAGDRATVVGAEHAGDGENHPAGMTKHLLIDGELVVGAGVFESVNPASGGVVGVAADASVGQVGDAVGAARRAFDGGGWAGDVGLRVRCLGQLYAALMEHREELRELTIAEVGAPRVSTYGAQLDEPIEVVRYYADLLRRHPMTEDLGEVEIRGRRHHRWVEKEAAGVVSAIIAYNYPNQLALAKLVPALAAGCTVVVKAAPDTPLVTLALGELIAGCTEIPAGVVNVVASSGVGAGEVLTTHPDVDVVSFTGSTVTGRKIMAAASGTVKRVFLELGGKSALILLDDADQATAAQAAAYTICSHAGQGCAITSRLLVRQDQHDAVVERVAAHLERVPYGDPGDPKVFMGPLISGGQREKVDGLVRRAVAAGARLVTGGEKVDPGFFYTPTLLAGVDADSEIAREEVFGPVLVVIPYVDEDDAVRIANRSIYGLSGAVYSGDEQRAIRVARRIRTGTLSINGGSFFAPDAPFGGYKQSGIGREMGVPGLAEFQETKTFATVVA